METKTKNKDKRNLENNNNKSVNINPARFRAIKILNRFERSDAYIDVLLNKQLDELESREDKGLLVEIVNGVIRWRWRLDWALVGFYIGDYLKCLNIVKNSMRVALYQIMFLDKIPTYAAVNESVEFVKKIQGDKTASIVNGVLRNIERNLENIRYPKKAEDAVYYYAVTASHPRWTVKKWLDRFGEEQTVKLLEANNRKPDLIARVNTLKSNPEEIRDKLTNLGVEFETSPYDENIIIIKSKGFAPTKQDLFETGKITVQDASAYMAAKLANPQPGDIIADLCSAPGGKAFALADLSNNQAKIIAIDKYKSKLRFIEEGAERLGVSLETMKADAAEVEFEAPLDIAFVDAPCSGTGTISKKPDIKWKRDIDDIKIMVNTQRQLLKNAAKLVKVGGVILYSTCSIENEENEENVEWFLKEHPEFEIDKAEKYLPKEVCKNGFLQTFPHLHKSDGAFAARLVKRR